jgi:hypothetical protein
VLQIIVAVVVVVIVRIPRTRTSAIFAHFRVT